MISFKLNINFLVLLLVCLPTYSQFKLKIVDKIDNKPVSYANIYLKGKTFGTVSNENGEFIIDKNILDKNDTLTISHLSYKTEYFYDIPKNFQFELTQKEEQLKEININNEKRKFKEKIVGTKTKSGKVIIYFATNNFGSEVGKLIKVPKNNLYELNNLSFMIYDFGFKSAILRVNFYKMTAGIIENHNCNSLENIIEVTEKGNIEFDFRKQNLYFSSDFIVSLELLNFIIDPNIPNDKRRIDISSTVFSGPYFNRENIHLNWIEAKDKFNLGLGLSLSVNSFKNE